MQRLNQWMGRHLGRRALCALWAASGLAVATAAPAADAADEWLWLEDVDSPRAMEWVKAQNQISQTQLASQPLHAALKSELRQVLDAKDRIAQVQRRGAWLYNFWQDAQHKRGIWRRTTMASYRSAEPQWETVLDLDAVGKAESESWVWGGAVCLADRPERCLLRLSRGGSDAAVMREYDIATQSFVPGGFSLPEAKYEVDWVDMNTLLVGTRLGEGSLTESGYPRQIRRWSRGTDLASAPVVFEGEVADVAASASVDRSPQHFRVLYTRALDFYRQKHWIENGHGAERQVLDVPADARIGFMNEWLIIHLRSDWIESGKTWKTGTLLVTPLASYLQGKRDLTALFEPTPTRMLDAWVNTAQSLVLSVQDNIAGRLEVWKRVGSKFERQQLRAPSPGNLNVRALHDPYVLNDEWAESVLVQYADFLTPDTLFLGNTDGRALEALQSRKPQFDADGMKVEQLWATSKDGTRVPYFVLWPKGMSAETAAGKAPTLLYGYGGFNVSMDPYYSGSVGRGWLSRGGVRVIANIRGGGEFGPGWHKAAIMENKQRSYDDFIAVAQDLIQRGITSPQHLGIMGGSNGGLLVGAVMVQRPDLFNAVVIQVPLLDMRRYHLLLAGASWVAEYGQPDDPLQWAWISKYSPYQNLKAGVRYPKPFIVTSTRDDRVHPGHARKMAARMAAQGHPVLYYENIEGGHAGSADNEQRAHWQALEYTYLWEQLGAVNAQGRSNPAP